MKIVRLLFIFILAGAVFFYYVFSPADPNSEKTLVIEIQEGEGLRVIANKLHLAGIIRSEALFRLYAGLTGRAGKLQAGVYEFSPGENVAQIADKIAKGKIATILLTVPEGFSIKNIEGRFKELCLQKNYYCQLDLNQLKARHFKSEFDFLKNIPDEASLEGFLFPDTYIFGLGDKAEKIAKRMLAQFAKNITPEFLKAMREQDRSIQEIVIMASLLEKEVRTFEDKKLVSGILWKRLESGMPLQVDATLTYITGKKTTKISLDELQIDNPYNTYKYKGLPPGPISNPGLDSLQAALHPESSPYWFYLSTPEGETIFSQTFQEHVLAKEKYLGP